MPVTDHCVLCERYR